MSVTDVVKTDSFEMEYIRFGQGKNTFVIIPGISVQSVIPSAELIEKQYEIFKNDFTVYLFDYRANPPKGHTVSDMADDTAAAMMQLGLSDACVFGASLGGMLAMQLAVKYPQLVGGLALGSTVCRVDENCSTVLDEWLSLAQANDAQSLYLSFGEKVYPKAVFEQYRSTFIDMAKAVTADDIARFITLAKGANGFDISKELHKINCPVLAIGDTDDFVFGAAAISELAAGFGGNPDFEMHMYQGFGHAAYDTAPDYAERLFRFFNNLRG